MKLQPWDPDIRSLTSRIASGELDLQPDFQRQEVWPLPKQKRLIDTIFRDWSIPPVHLVVKADGGLEVLDGQQRLVAIRDFANDKFSIDGLIAPLDARIERLHGTFYSQLGEKDKRAFDQFTIRSFRISDYKPEEPSELFYRLNQPTGLTSGEKRNALYGPARSQLKELVSEFQNLGNSQESIGFSNSRLAYDDVLARLLFFVENGSFAIKATEAAISDSFRSTHGFQAKTLRFVRRAIQLFSSERALATTIRLNKASLLSWLLFFGRFKEGVPASTPLADFYSPNFARSARFVDDARRTFDDRASLRVTDVSSVVFRDFSLWFIYYFTGSEELPFRTDTALFRLIAEDLDERPDVSFEFALDERLDIESWGRLS
jgi:hypothetical protein